MDQVAAPDPASDIVIEALSREDGKNSTVRVYRDRIEWLMEQSISSLPRPKHEPPVIPLHTVSSVKVRRDGPLFSKVLLRTGQGTITFRMHTPQAVQVRDILAELLDAGPTAPLGPPVAPPPAAETAGDDLRQLEQLRDDGMLSPEEFEAARSRLGAG